MLRLIVDLFMWRNRWRVENSSNLGLLFFFSLFVEDGALFGVTAFRADIGFTLEPEDRFVQSSAVFTKTISAPQTIQRTMRLRLSAFEAASAAARYEPPRPMAGAALLGLGGSSPDHTETVARQARLSKLCNVKNFARNRLGSPASDDESVRFESGGDWASSGRDLDCWAHVRACCRARKGELSAQDASHFDPRYLSYLLLACYALCGPSCERIFHSEFKMIWKS